MSSLQTKVQQNIDLLNFVLLHSIINNPRHEKYLIEKHAFFIISTITLPLNSC